MILLNGLGGVDRERICPLRGSTGIGGSSPFISPLQTPDAMTIFAASKSVCPTRTEFPEIHSTETPVSIFTPRFRQDSRIAFSRRRGATERSRGVKSAL